MSVSLSKKEGNNVFKVVGKSKDKGRKFKIDTEKDGEPIREYKTTGQLQLLPPSKNDRMVIVISGPSGVGKSFFASNLIREYKKKFKNNPFYLCSPKTDDENINELNPNVIKINEYNFIESPIDLDELENSIILFDDCEGVNSNLKKYVDEFIDRICVVGRSKNISCIIITHLLQNYKTTRVMLSEAHCIVLFPQGGNTYMIKAFLLKNGLTKQQIEKIVTAPSRWICYHKCFPQYILTQNEFYFL